MTRTIYVPVEEINKLQTDIMHFVIDWVRTKRMPVPHREVLKAMEKNQVPDRTTCEALSSLLKKGYIRRGAGAHTNTTEYVQIRTL